MTDYVPENSDENNPPEQLQTETLQCGNCECEFATVGGLQLHEAGCVEDSCNECD